MVSQRPAPYMLSRYILHTKPTGQVHNVLPLYGYIVIRDWPQIHPSYRMVILDVCLVKPGDLVIQ